MAFKFPISPLQNERESISKENSHIISDMFSQYHETQRKLEIEKNQFLVSQMVSYTNVDTELNINTIKQRENKQNILFLERYPGLAVRHVMGLSWGTTSPR
jgi:TATA-box binding protein (TBP) (component of TFIID and TFIIIB)